MDDRDDDDARGRALAVIAVVACAVVATEAVVFGSGLGLALAAGGAALVVWSRWRHERLRARLARLRAMLDADDDETAAPLRGDGRDGHGDDAR